MIIRALYRIPVADLLQSATLFSHLHNVCLLCRSPDTCLVQDCDIIVSWRTDPQNSSNIYYEIRSRHPHDYTMGYVALGWSKDKLMVNPKNFI